MRNLLVLRHAKSSWSHPGLDDHDRPLNKRGERTAPRMGRFIAERGLIPDRIISSTAVRAHTTAEEIARHCGFEGSVRTTRQLYLAAPDEYLAVLWALPDNPRRVMVVGHNPGMEALAVGLCAGAAQHVHLRMPTTCCAHLQLEIVHWSQIRWGCGELSFLLPPKLLRMVE